MHRPLIYAHRGASHEAPENTMSAFQLAKEIGADGFELDVQLTKDGKVIIIHDDKIDRTSNGKGIAEKMYYDDLRRLDFGSWKDGKYKGEPIPTLENVGKYAKENNLLLNIEIKPALDTNEIEDKVISICKSLDIVDSVVVSSFSHYCVRSIKKKFNRMETAILYQSGFIDIGSYARRKVKADGIHPHKFALVSECVKSAVKNGMKIRPWTVDDVNMFKKLAEIKYITGVITNHPDVMKKILDEMMEVS